ncbi:MAG: hypothetical protein ACPG44_07845 [Polaribacter sp.]|uniref:Uncharacterized protein n=1 Tax=Nonlabens ulvanivorans TaxID=906888 RepID=A0A081D9S3_NONUL|nr:hypothetical protein [Nonlabens ulvanivorans]GAK75669.1 hypothetical protein JCM19296_1261 [Nonlabens ulvanivorans]
MENFESEPLKNYLLAHTKLNNYIKVSTVAVDYLYNSKENNEELSTLISDLILDSGERWRPRKIKDSKGELNVLKNDLSKTGVIWVYSAFDVFFKKVEGIMSDNFTKVKDPKSDEGDRLHKVIEFYKKLGWSTNKIDNLLPILKFYESLRHSIAHNVGIPSEKLYELSTSDSFNSSILNWQTKFPKKKISPPPIVEKEAIILRPHHSITYSETCLRITKDINRRIYETLGRDFFINKTIKKHLISAEKLSEPFCANYSRYIVYHLNMDYKIELKKYDEVYETYDDNEKLKEDKKRYHIMKSLT